MEQDENTQARSLRWDDPVEPFDWAEFVERMKSYRPRPSRWTVPSSWSITDIGPLPPGWTSIERTPVHDRWTARTARRLTVALRGGK